MTSESHGRFKSFLKSLFSRSTRGRRRGRQASGFEIKAADRSVELLEPRLMLSGDETPDELVGALPDAGFAQVFFLNFHGADRVSYDGPVTVGEISVPGFDASHVGLGGQEQQIISDVAAILNEVFASSSATFVTEQPVSGPFSTIYVGGDDSAFAEFGSFLGVAEKVDTGNADHNDQAFVFSRNLNASSRQAFTEQLAAVIGHEAEHLLGRDHEGENRSGGVLSGVAYADGAADATELSTNAVHSYLTGQGVLLFTSQFGNSALNRVPGFVSSLFPVPVGFEATQTALYRDQNGEARIGSDNYLVEGAYDEDQGNQSGFNEGEVDHPSIRHFWDVNADFSRTFDDGLLGFDSAANRSIKYVTGGFGLTSVFDSSWRGTAGVGANRLFDDGEFGSAFYLLGHSAHLVQDLTLTSHAIADQHIEKDIFGLYTIGLARK
ncbi:MAG: LEPR-XLL domain-containing protein [Planctomycetaceae bacterium]|nr:LEPR-XLL domain-containing protein [Planctomycetaceae bacterium]